MRDLYTIRKSGNATVIMVVITIMIFGLVALFAYKGFGIGDNIVNEGKQIVENVILGSGDSKTDALNSQSESDELDAIDKDLNNTDLDSLDSDLDEIDAELNSF